MAWPKKGTHKITVQGQTYLWHYAAHCPLCSNDVITVGQEGKPHVLYLDPFPWSFEFRPKAIAEALEWALGRGWSVDKGPTMAMALDDNSGEFVWLGEGERHLEDSK